MTELLYLRIMMYFVLFHFEKTTRKDLCKNNGLCVAWHNCCDLFTWHQNDRCDQGVMDVMYYQESAGWRIMTLVKYAMSSLFAPLLARASKTSLRGNSNTSCPFCSFSSQANYLVRSILLSIIAVRCDVIRASSGKNENSSFAWSIFCARISKAECIIVPELMLKWTIHTKMRGEKSSLFG